MPRFFVTCVWAAFALTELGSVLKHTPGLCGRCFAQEYMIDVNST